MTTTKTTTTADKPPALTALSDPAATAAIDTACRTLMLPTVRAEAAAMAAAAAKQRLAHRSVPSRGPARRVRRTRRPSPGPTAQGSEVSPHQETRRLRHQCPARLPPATLDYLASGGWIDKGEPLVLLGDSGTGKTHLLIALGRAAAEQGRRVRYVTTAALVNELIEAADDKEPSRVVGRYARLDLLCLDELGYVHLDPAAPSCSSRSSPPGRNEPRSRAHPTRHPLNGGATFTVNRHGFDAAPV